jgi:hypothetical protein
MPSALAAGGAAAEEHQREVAEAGGPHHSLKLSKRKHRSGLIYLFCVLGVDQKF